jgi:hypothetical protein
LDPDGDKLTYVVVKVVKEILNGTIIVNSNDDTLSLPSWLVYDIDGRRFYGTPNEMDV